MKIKSFLMMMALVLSFASMNAQAKKKEVKEITYQVAMDCQSCVNKINKNLAFEKGVKDLKADLESQTVYVKYRADKTSSDKLVAALKKLGFEAKEHKEGCTAKKKACCAEHDHDHDQNHKH